MSQARLFAEAKRILCVGAHSDDIEIGCGGTILRLIQERPSVHVAWHVFSAPGARRAEARKSATEFLRGAASAEVRLHSWRESFFPQHWAEIKTLFEKLKAFQPDLILTHWREDRHQDHRVLSDLAWNTFRDHPILEYEIPKYDGDLGTPNLYVSLSEETCRRKVGALMRHFKTQARRHWFTEDTFLALPRLRGVECGSRARYAEAFYCRKLVV